MVYTIKEIAKKLEVDEASARGLMRYLLNTDPPMARCRGERPSPIYAGHGFKVYEVDADAPTLMRIDLQKLT